MIPISSNFEKKVLIAYNYYSPCCHILSSTMSFTYMYDGLKEKKLNLEREAERGVNFYPDECAIVVY